MNFDDAKEESGKALRESKNNISKVDAILTKSYLEEEKIKELAEALKDFSDRNIKSIAFDVLDQLDETLKSIKFENYFSTFDEIADMAKKLGTFNKNPRDETKVLKDKFEELQNKYKLRYIYHRINEAAQTKLLNDEKFRKQFEEVRKSNAVVFSLDIRRSTELMLKSRTPDKFSEFINELIKGIIKIIQKNYGIFDKFTGDGILAFFPDFYSGKDALFYALKSSIECHEEFNKVYDQSKSCFNVILNNIGLGIGIDYGEVSLNIINNEYTVVGVPVVYACRMSNTEASNTLLNQQAYEVLTEKYQHIFKCEITSIDIKHEGEALAYRLVTNKIDFAPEVPAWVD